MKRYQTILVAAALDDRDASTMQHAARFASAAGSQTVYVAHVAPTFDLPAAVAESQPDLVIPVDEEIEQKLRALIQEQASHFPAATTFHDVERQGSFVPESIRLAAQKSVDLFCLGRRQAQDFDPQSEAAMRLLRETPCSVLLVPSGTEARYDRILVPVDFSSHSREVLEVAFAIARSLPGATVTALHVYSVPLGWYKSPHSHEEFAEIMKANAEREWLTFKRDIDMAGIDWNIRFELGDEVPKAILDVADEIQADLVMLGSHGVTQPACYLLGHVAESVCARTSRPVLCLKRKGEVVNLLQAILKFLGIEGE